MYAAAQLGSQFHTCVYSILIVKEQEQLIQWDRTGAVVSEPIFYNEDGALMEFFHRYHDAPLDVHSVDTTVTVPNPKDMRVAREHLGHGTDQLLMEITPPVAKSTWSFIVPILKA